MSLSAGVLAGDSRVWRERSTASTAERAQTWAWRGVCLLVIVAPFEGLRPLLELPGQSLTSVETVLLTVFGVWLLISVRWRTAPIFRTSLTLPWLTFIGCAFVVAAVSPDRQNALHMSSRFALAFGVYLLTVNGVTSPGRLRGLIVAGAVAGIAIAALVGLEYANSAPVMQWLQRFRAAPAHVGAQLRAGGPFQYPTIASMYLEILFALTLGLMAFALDRGWKAIAGVVAVALVLMAEAVTLTFTRAGFITMASSLAIVCMFLVRAHGLDRRLLAFAFVGIMIGGQFVTARSVELLRLRLTTEGQNAWYHASIDAPPDVAVATGTSARIPVTVTNVGYSSWDPHAANPFRLSYHWLLADEDRVVSWEGTRTEFPGIVHPGDSVQLVPAVVAPRQPGRYRLMWDIEQVDRLWFSSEPEAEVFMSRAIVSGPAAGAIDRSQLPALPKRSIRPGRLVLWDAAGRMVADHPLLGVGPDNFRLRYGEYAGLPGADSRVHANNMYLEVLAGGGALLALPFVWLVFSVAARARSAGRRSTLAGQQAIVSGIVAAAAAIALHGLVDSFLGFTATYILIAVTIGLVEAADRLNTHAHRV
jgi:hypothetical protein